MSGLKHPYYIVSPNYRESSGGIQALHKLCHQINLRGGSAWMVDCNIINAKWNTPILDAKTFEQHRKSDVIPVAVYPEIYSGNPLNAEVCVRYMLNHEALLNGNRLNESEEDIFFWYSSQLIVKEPKVDFLTMVGPDLNMFYDDGRTKKTKLLYLNRVPEEAVNFSALPEDITVISVKKPRPLEELAEILKSAIVMYTYEWSGTCNLAALCGVPVISLVAPYYEKLAISEASVRDMGGAGVCFSDDEQELQNTRKEIHKVREHMQMFEANFSTQLTHFFNKTQSAAQIKSNEKFVPLERWLRDYPNVNCLQHNKNALLSFMIVVLDEGEKNDLDKTLSSLAALGRDSYVYSLPVDSGDNEIHNSFNEWLKRKLEQNKSEWVLFIHAGDIVYPHLFSNLALFKEKINLSLAFYSDRVFHQPDGNKRAHFLSEFDLDSFLEMPERFTSGTFFRREVCYEVAMHHEIIPRIVEMVLLLQVANANLESDIHHVPLPLFEIKRAESFPSSISKALLAEHLSLKGYPNASLEHDGAGIYTINYYGDQVKKITVVILIENEEGWIKRTLATFVDSVKNIDYEIILIDNFTNNQSLKAWLNSIEQINEDVFRVYFTDKKISAVSALNFAFSVARGEFMLHLAYGVFFENNGWLDALINHCGRYEVTACAPALLDSHNKYFSSGLVNGHLAETYEQQASAHNFYESSAPEPRVSKRFLVLSAECIMIRTASCHEAGGLDEQLSDIQEAISDLLLRIVDKNHINLFIPRAVVRFENFLSTKEKAVADNFFAEKWMATLASDPGYNVNLKSYHDEERRENNTSLLAAKLGLELKALFITDKGNHAEIARYNELSQVIQKREGLRSTVLHRECSLSDCYRVQPKNIILSDVMAVKSYGLLKNKSRFPDSRFIIELTAASFSRTGNEGYHSKEMLEIADGLLVRNTSALKLFDYENVYLQLDKLGSDWVSLPQSENDISKRRNKPRVGIVLAGLQPEDWRLIDALIKEMSGDVFWIIYGACPDAWKPYIHEYHRKVPQIRLKEMLQSLKLELALAPLSHSLANEAEGHRIIIQLGACGYPVLASDHKAYEAIKSALLIKNKTSQWRYMIKKIVNDKVYCRHLSEEIYSEVNTCWIHKKDDIPVWLS